MTTGALQRHGQLPPDAPLRRLVWVVPLALLLVWLAISGTGRWLRTSAPAASRKPAAIDARIYELPPARGGAAAKAPSVAHPPRATVHSTKVPASPHRKRSESRSPVRTVRRRGVDWAALASQINAAVSSAAAGSSEFNQVHDPHTLIARYYLAALLKKLQRTGDMIYPDDKTGSVMVRLIVGADGAVRALEVDAINGASGLKGVARQIVHMAMPFAPFPDKLARATRRLKLEIRMAFLGAHNVNTR